MLKCIHLIDEAGNAFSRELSQPAGSGYISAAKRAITQIRKTGTGIFAGVQAISETDDCLKSNVGTIICLNNSNPKDAREAAQILLLPETGFGENQNLPVGFGYVRSEGFSAPVKIQIPHFDLGPYPSDAEVARRMEAEFARLEQDTIRSPSKSEEAQAFSYLEILGEINPLPIIGEDNPAVEDEPRQLFAEHRSLLRDIEEHANASVDRKSVV